MNKKYIVLKIIFIFSVFLFFVGIIFLIKNNIDNAPVKLKWNKIENAKETIFNNNEIFRDNVSFQWNSKTYLGSNSTSKLQDITSRGEFFRLSENGKTILNLDKEKNEMRYFQFQNCQTQLCIWGTDMHSTQWNMSPTIDLQLVLFPSKKEYAFSNPCKNPEQIDKFNVRKIKDNDFVVEVKCGAYNNGRRELFNAIINVDKLAKN